MIIFIYNNTLTYFFAQIYFFDFMEAADIPVYENIALFLKYCAICLNIDYTLRCLEYSKNPL